MNKLELIIHNSIHKKNLVENFVTKLTPQRIKFLKPRIDFSSTKKIFEYKILQKFIINLVIKKNKLVYSSLNFKLESKCIYSIEKDFKINLIKYPWYKVYNKLPFIQNWLLHLKTRILLKKEVFNYIVKIGKFENIEYILLKKKEFFPIKIKYLLIGKRLRGLVSKFNFTKVIIPTTKKKYFKNHRFKTIIKEKIILKDLNNNNNIKIKINNLFFIIIKKLKLFINNLFNNNIFIYDYSLFLKYFFKYYYCNFLLKIIFLIIPKISYNYYYFIKTWLFYEYKSFLLLINFTKKKIYFSVINKILKYNYLNINSNLYLNNFKYININFNNNFLKIFLNYILYIFYILEKNNNFYSDNKLLASIDFYRGKKVLPSFFFSFVKLDYKHLKLLKKFKFYKFNKQNLLNKQFFKLLIY